MTPREISFGVGVNISTVYRHLNNHTLEGQRIGGRWSVPSWEVMCWSRYLWNQGRVLMFPPSYTEGFIENFHLS